MGVHKPSDIRNIVVTGTAGSGKTTLIERLLFLTGTVNRMGSVEDGTTVSDHTDEAKKYKHSLSSSIVSLDRNGVRVNLIDTPGLGDFLGHAIASLPAGELVMVVIDATKGPETTSRRIMTVAADRKLPRMIVINKMDHAEVELADVVERLQAMFGSECLPINLPTAGRDGVVNVFEAAGGAETAIDSVDDAHTRIIDQVVETDEDLMAEYLEKGAEGLNRHAVHAAFIKALRTGHLVPICFVSARTAAGAEDLLHILVDFCPNPEEGNPRPFVRTTAEGEQSDFAAEPDPDRPVVAHIFKVASDPFVGKLGVFRIHQGTVRAKSELFIDDLKKPLRINHILRVQGKDHADVDAAGPGDIVAVAKIDEIHFNGVLHSEPHEFIKLRPLPLPKPMYGLAVELKNHKDESKFGPAVAKLQAEDPCFVVERVAATRQTVMRGLGEMHLRVILDRLKEQYGIEVETSPPKVAYKETIAAKAEGHHRHKKQTGGSGEFGEVYLRVMALPSDHEEGFEFENMVVGGSIPRQYMPAIEKGVRQALTEGAIAGYPMTGIRVEVYDGKYHDVDSKEVAFIKAGKRAFIDAVQKAKPVLLEPFVELEVTVPSGYLGDIAADLSTKRGRVQDTQMAGADTCVIKAIAPLGELRNYSNELKSITGGAGSFAMDYSHDERTPAHIQAEVIAAFKPREDED